MELNYLSFQANKVHKAKRAPISSSTRTLIKQQSPLILLYKNHTHKPWVKYSKNPLIPLAKKKKQFILELT